MCLLLLSSPPLTGKSLLLPSPRTPHLLTASAILQVSFEAKKDVRRWVEVGNAVNNSNELDLRITQFIPKCPLPFVNLYLRSAEKHTRKLVNEMLRFVYKINTIC